MSRKANLILFIITSLFLAMLASRNGSFGLVAIPFLIYLGAGSLTSPGDVHLRVTRSLDSVRCREDTPVTMVIRVENAGPTIHCLRLVEDLVPRIRLIEGDLTRWVSIPAGGEIEFRAVFTAPRGRYEWQSVNAIVSDPFGLFKKSIQVETPVRLLVTPEPPVLRRFQLHPRNTIHTPGSNLSRLPGCGVDFWGVREYRPGDSLRLIHWQKMARHPMNFFSKEFEREEMADIGLILDTRDSDPRTAGDGTFFNHSIQATAALAKSFLRAGNRVSLLAMGERMIRVFPGYGKRQLVHILDQLANCQQTENGSLDTLRYIPVRLFPSHAMIVIISPLRRHDYKTIARLRAEGYQILVVSPNPVRYVADQWQVHGSNGLALRLVALERAILLWRIRQLGVEVIDWMVDQPLDRAVRFVRRGRG